MPTPRKDIKKSKFSRYGQSLFSKETENTKYFATLNTKQPTMRGAFPKPIKVARIGDKASAAKYEDNYSYTTIDNSSFRRISFPGSKVKSNVYSGSRRKLATVNQTSQKSNLVTQSSISESKFEGGAVRKLGFSTAQRPQINSNAAIETEIPKEFKTAPAQKTIPAKKPASKRKKQMHAVRGSAKKKGILQSNALSPVFLTLGKCVASLVVVVAVLSFVRVGLTSATVTQGIQSQKLSAQIENELSLKSQLEVADSQLGNSTRLREIAGKYNLVAPTSIEQITLAPDYLVQKNDKEISVVESLKKLSHSAK